MITSHQNAKIKAVRTLMGRPKARQQAGAFVAEGVRLVEDALRKNWTFRFALYSGIITPRGLEVVKDLRQKKVDVEEISDRLLQPLSDTQASQGLLAVLELPTENVQLPRLEFVLVPDQIRDPGNLGALLRTAAAAGVQVVWIPPETTDPFAPKVVRAGMGAHFHLLIQHKSWEEIRHISESLKLTLYLADMGGHPCWDIDLSGPLAMIIGGEAEGASEQARHTAQAAVGIPMPGEAESLNAAAAGAILMFEVVHQRRGRIRT